MFFVRKIDVNGMFIEDAFVEGITERTIETPCPSGFYHPKWDGSKWVEGLTQVQINEIIASKPVDMKAEAVAEIESATTIAGLRAAMLKYVNAE